MLCDEFEARLNDVLDARQSPEQDLELQRHAHQCTACQAQLHALTCLLDGLELSEDPPLPDDFAWRIVEQACQNRRPFRPRAVQLAALAIAATLLLATLPFGWVVFGPSPQITGSARQIDAPPSDAVASAKPPETSIEDPDDSQSGWLVPSSSILELYPAEARQRHREQVTQLADDLRPIATPFNAAMAAIRRTIPQRSSSSKGQPRASLQPHRSTQNIS